MKPTAHSFTRQPPPMNDEPHSHKKATVALVAVLLLAYVGSYLWFRQWRTGYVEQGYILLETPKSVKWPTGREFFNRFYWPLRKLDEKIMGKEVLFMRDLIISRNF